MKQVQVFKKTLLSLAVISVLGGYGINTYAQGDDDRMEEQHEGENREDEHKADKIRTTNQKLIRRVKLPNHSIQDSLLEGSAEQTTEQVALLREKFDALADEKPEDKAVKIEAQAYFDALDKADVKVADLE